MLDDQKCIGGKCKTSGPTFSNLVPQIPVSHFPPHFQYFRANQFLSFSNEFDVWLGSLAVACRTSDREVTGLTSGRSTGR